MRVQMNYYAAEQNSFFTGNSCGADSFCASFAAFILVGIAAAMSFFFSSVSSEVLAVRLSLVIVCIIILALIARIVRVIISGFPFGTGL